MLEMRTARHSGRTSWLVGVPVLVAVASGCSNATDQGSGAQVGASAGFAASASAGTRAPSSAGVSAPMPGLTMMMNGVAGVGMPPSAAGRGAGFDPQAGAGGAHAAADGGADSGAQAGTGGVAGAAGSAGASGSAGGGAGAAGARSSGDISSVCMGGMMGQDSMTAKTNGSVSEYAAVKYLAAAGNQILSLKTTLLVPKTPTQKQTLFIWPGLQCNNGKDPARIGNGILQPVLTWGPSCNPKLPSDSYTSWWMAAMYVNVSTAAAGPTGCAGGDFMSTALGDLLQIDMSVTGTAWKQTILDMQTMKSVDFTIDLKGQVQNWATWAIEVPQGESIMPNDNVVFTQSVLTFESPVTSCQPSQHGPNDYFSAPIRSMDGRNCCYDKIILRARGAPVTTM
jgi:hypothetical protein